MNLNLKTFNILYFLFISTFFPQTQNNRISGKVIDSNTGTPLPNANVFISGSVWGTSTNMDGYFSIQNLPSGNHQIAVSFIGYETTFQNVTLTGKDHVELNFYLIEKLIQLNEVAVDAEVPKDWYENLEVFKMYFFGQSGFAEYCVIENETIIDFVKGENILSASADDQLIIINNALGYRIDCNLISFDYDYEFNSIRYFTVTKFTELLPESDNQKKEWIENREAAYLGSIKHFLVSLIRNDINGNRFKMFSWYGSYGQEIKDVRKLLAKDSLSNQYILKFDYDLVVQYKPGVFSNTQVSGISLLVDYVTLDEFGEPKETLPFFFKQHWATKGIADLLPKDYSNR
ncbi:MAG: carboxypeptidase-like regulatory domain-containing protein [Melioribacteraceae bacterium]|nr:carboxypeptidase-like regulatory domain-containing protein [Melioribacteraceae bacterium]